MAFDDIHPRFAGYDRFFAQELRPALATLEEKRKVAWSRGWRIALPVALIGGTVLLWLGLGFFRGQFLWGGLPHMLLMAATAVVTLGLAWLAFAPLRKIRGQGKRVLMEGTCRFLGFAFEPSASGFSLEPFYAHGLLRRADRERRSDRIHGTVDGVSFDLCEVRLRERRAGRRRRYRTVFRGQIAIFDAPLTFEGRTLIARDSGFIGNFFKRTLSGRERVEIGDGDFEKRYEVYSDRPAEARQLLGPELRSCILALAEGLGVAPAIGLVENKVLLAADTRDDRFEVGGLMAPLDAEAEIRRLLTEVAEIFRIVETLKLTPRRA